MTIYTHTPADVAKWSCWTPPAQRDARLKGYLENYGSQNEGGRWFYSIRDLVAFWLADMLHERKPNRLVDLRELYENAWHMSEHVVKHIAYLEAPILWGFGHYKREKGSSQWGETLSLNAPVRFVANTYEQVAAIGMYSMEIVDMREIATYAPEGLCIAVKAEMEA